MQSTQILLASRPEGEPAVHNFETVTVDLQTLEEGQVLLRVIYLSLDPYMRGRMSAAKSYAASAEVGAVLMGDTVGEVLESRDPKFAAGDVVLSYSGWQTHAVADGAHLRKLDPAKAPICRGRHTKHAQRPRSKFRQQVRHTGSCVRGSSCRACTRVRLLDAASGLVSDLVSFVVVQTVRPQPRMLLLSTRRTPMIAFEPGSAELESV